MGGIALNSAVRSNLRTLQQTTDLMSKTENRLSTGKKVNSALDNPGSFFTAQALDRRSKDLGTLLDNVSNSVKTIEAADNGISAISDLVTQMKSTARSAQQSTSAVTTKASFTSSAITGATESNLLGTTTSATATTLSGVGAVAATYTGGTLSINGTDVTIADDSDAATVKSAIDAAGITGLTVTNTSGTLSFSLASGEDLTLSSSTAALADNLGLSAAGGADTDVTSTNGTPASGGELSGKTLTVQVGTGSTASITFGTSSGQVDTLEELNDSLAAYNAKASISSDGKLTIESTNEYGAKDVTIGGTAVSTDGSAAAGEIFGLASPSAATKSATLGGDGKTTRTNYMNDYNDLREQVKQLAKDASYNGVNLLASDDLSVVFNETGDSKLDVSGVDLMDRLGLSDLTFDDFADSSSIDSVVSKIGTALNSLDSLSSRLGSQLSVVQTRQSFTKDMIGTLDDGSNALTGADTNAEAANLATLQTRQSLIVSSLSISTSQEQNVLQLLR